MSFQLLLEIDRDPAFRMGMGRSFHQTGMVNENVLESDFEPLCDGTTRRLSLADLRLPEGMSIRNSEWSSRMGAEPVVVLYVSISVLNWMRAATGSQCKETKRGVTWALLGSLKTSRALHSESFVEV